MSLSLSPPTPLHISTKRCATTHGRHNHACSRKHKTQKSFKKKEPDATISFKPNIHKTALSAILLSFYSNFPSRPPPFPSVCSLPCHSSVTVHFFFPVPWFLAFRSSASSHDCSKQLCQCVLRWLHRPPLPFFSHHVSFLFHHTSGLLDAGGFFSIERAPTLGPHHDMPPTLHNQILC